MAPTPDHNGIVVGVDGSTSSIDALRYAATIASALDCPLLAVITWVSPMAGKDAPRGDLLPAADAESRLTRAISKAFKEMPPPGLTTRVIAGPTAPTLIAASTNARMLVLGSRGRGGFVGLLLGSVSAACAERAHCPVLIVRSARSRGRLTVVQSPT